MSGWTQSVNGVAALVPGQILFAPFPNLIVLNTESGEASWETSSQEWIPEDEAYDHLAVKIHVNGSAGARQSCIAVCNADV